MRCPRFRRSLAAKIKRTFGEDSPLQLPEQKDFPIYAEISKERDRGAAVIAAGFLDTKLTDAIKACLRSDSDTAKKLLKPTGPLGAFGTKIDLGYMLKLYR